MEGTTLKNSTEYLITEFSITVTGEYVENVDDEWSNSAPDLDDLRVELERVLADWGLTLTDSCGKTETRKEWD